MGNFKFTVLGQGICSSQDLFNYITDGNIKLDEDFNCLKTIDIVFKHIERIRRPNWEANETL